MLTEVLEDSCNAEYVAIFKGCLVAEREWIFGVRERVVFEKSVLETAALVALQVTVSCWD
jgi:hypothetical protein